MEELLGKLQNRHSEDYVRQALSGEENTEIQSIGPGQLQKPFSLPERSCEYNAFEVPSPFSEPEGHVAWSCSVRLGSPAASEGWVGRRIVFE